MNNLSIDMRPRTMDEVVGHDAVKASIKKQIDSGSIPRAFMFSGPAGLGKTTMALIVAKMLNPDTETIDLIEHNAADLNGVEDVRQLVEACAYRPLSGQFRVVVLNECQMLTIPAQNCLLQPFESEDSATIFILTTTDPSKIIQPLQDRCKHFKLRPLSAEVEIAELIERASEALGVECPSAAVSAFIAQATNSGIGSPRVLLQAYEKMVSGIPLKDCFANAAHEPFYKDIALTICKGDWNTCRSLLAQVQTADSRALRGIVAGFLRSALVKQDFGPKADAISACLLGLGSSFEDGIAWSVTVSCFYRCCKAISATK